jgi:3-oxoacyl-[acyl-carrier protein] reductase
MRRRALVTGASRGIGAAVARALGAAGHRVLVNYRTRAECAEAVVREIREGGGAAEAIGFDVSDADAVTRAYSALDLRGDPIDIVVNNAAVIRDGLFASLSAEDWRAVLATSLDGFYHVTRPLILPMVRRRWGRVVNVVSTSGRSGNRGQVNYSTAKAGLVGATKALAKEVAGRGVTVNAVCPGLIETDMIDGVDVAPLLERISLGRVGHPAEVAAAVCYLVSDAAAYVTGHVLRVDGGFAG